MRLPQHHVAAIKYDLSQIEQLLAYDILSLKEVAEHMDQLQESVALLRNSLNAMADESLRAAE